jgi:hypothetical protein
VYASSPLAHPALWRDRRCGEVRDAAALYEEWSKPGIAGHTHPAEPTPYGLLEGSHTDPDGNVIRFGSPIRE